MAQIYLNSLGICNALGSSLAEVSAQLFSESPQLSSYDVNLISGNKTPFLNVKGELPKIPDHLVGKFKSRNNQLSLLAMKEVESSVIKLKSKYGPERISVVMGTSTSGISEYEEQLMLEEGALDKGYNYSVQEAGNTSEFVANYWGLKGFAYTISTACSSSAKAIAEAKRLINSGLADVVIAGGTDSFCKLTLNGFDSLDAVSYKATNPFSANRSGINIGEGSAIFVVSKEEAEISLLGTGESSDAHHISAPDPTGYGPERALRQALDEAGVEPGDIGYINLHGTGTTKNDSMESLLVNRLFGSETLVSSTKPLTGHTLGAAGAQELGLTYLTLLNKDSKLPMHFWDNEIDESLKPLKFVNKDSQLVKPICMSNSFAFGGSNASVIIGRV